MASRRRRLTPEDDPLMRGSEDGANSDGFDSAAQSAQPSAHSSPAQLGISGAEPTDFYTVPSGVAPDETTDRFYDGDRGLSTAALRAKMQRIEDQMAADAEAERLRAEEAEEQMLMQLVVAKVQASKTETDFLDQERFRWSVPSSAEQTAVVPAKVVEGKRVRPVVSSVQPRIPPPPPAFISFEEQEAQYGERCSALQLKREAMWSQRQAAEFDMEETLFAIPSSDDSDGYDEDYQDLWREQTSEVFRATRPLECDPSNDQAATDFGRLIDRIVDEQWALNTAEIQLIWNAVRYTYQAAEPIHAKHWLRACHEIAETGSFRSRPSVANFAYVVRKAEKLTCMPARQRNKIAGWSARCAYLVRKRVIVLQEFGTAEPTWEAVNASVAGMSRSVKVPTMTMGDTLAALTAGSTQMAATGIAAMQLAHTERRSRGGSASGGDDPQPTGELIDLF